MLDYIDRDPVGFAKNLKYAILNPRTNDGGKIKAYNAITVAYLVWQGHADIPPILKIEDLLEDLRASMALLK
jgi:hypothetical protein